MFVAPIPSDAAAADPSEDGAAWRLQVLRELGEIGMALVRDVRDQALEPAEGAQPAPDVGLVFARLARAVRQTVALHGRLEAEAQARHDTAEAERAELALRRGIHRKRRVSNIVEHMLDHESDSDAERLSDNLREHLDDLEYADFADRPLGEIVASICKDLGVTIDWSLWEDEPWAKEAMRAETRSEATPVLPPREPDLPCHPGKCAALVRDP